MGVSLYTSRVVLNALGIEDYGVYSIVGGIVTLFSFFNSAMTSSTQRFLAFDIGKNDLEQLKKTFNATLNIHIAIALFVLILAETIGLWFVNNKLNLPLDRLIAANWVYQFSILTFLLGILQVPYDALIVAHEKMNIYAYMSFAEAGLKLLIVYLLVVFVFDKLILYAVLLFVVTFIVRSGHKYYCKRNYKESKYQFYYDKTYYKVLLSYSGWNLFGNIAGVARGQGVNILLNLFFGTVLNAAYGITMQLQVAVQTFVNNFQMAVNPQIIKNYAAGNIDQCNKLIFQSSKLSYFLMLIIVCPVIFNIDFILKIWLKTPPDFTSKFIILCLINLLIDCISGPIMTGVQATGNIKFYQIIVGTLVFLNLPISFFLLKIYKNPELVFFTSILISIFSLIFRLFFYKKYLQISISSFLKQVVLKLFLVSFLSIIIIFMFNKYIFLENEFILALTKLVVIIFIIIIIIFLLGINNDERFFIFNTISKKKNEPKV
ncbi:lipopolysaccharide biosynthesis protein [Flavobacterium saccharophilum]|nr:MATE family efflux transporter [Flavobacterium saccharophilum]